MEAEQTISIAQQNTEIENPKYTEDMLTVASVEHANVLEPQVSINQAVNSKEENSIAVPKDPL